MDHQRKGRLMYGFTTTLTDVTFEQAYTRTIQALKAVPDIGQVGKPKVQPVADHGTPIRAV
jgi:hypothetical protein